MSDNTTIKDTEPEQNTANPDVRYCGPDTSKDTDDISELKKKNNLLESRVFEMRETLRQIRLHMAAVESERDQYRREVAKYKTDIQQMKTPPMVIGSIEQILDDGRVVVHSTTGPYFVTTVMKTADTNRMVPGTSCSLHPQSFMVMEILPKQLDANVNAMEIEDMPDVTYADVGGLKNQIRQIREAVELPLKKPGLFEKVGIEPPKGVLMFGPPGTGKTLLAKAVARETNATFIRLVASELVQKFIGEGARMVRELFEMAREKAPSIVFIDEIDAIGASRGTDSYSAGDREVSRTLVQLLAELDGFDARGNVKFIAGTNRIDILDAALMRPGRFDRIIEFTVPDAEEREMILKIHTKKMHLSKNVDLSVIASDKHTDRFTGAELHALTVEAGMRAIRSSRTTVHQDDFLESLSVVIMGRDKTNGYPELPHEFYQ